MRIFDAKSEVKRLNAITQLRKKKRYVRSKLDKYKAEIIALRAEGATLQEIQIWLKQKNLSAEGYFSNSSSESSGFPSGDRYDFLKTTTTSNIS